MNEVREALTQQGPLQANPAEDGRVLVIDDEPVVVDVLRQLLVKRGYEVHVAGDGASGRQLLEEQTWDAVLLDVMLPDADGMELLRWIRDRNPNLAVVMITAFGTVESAVRAMKSGAFHYVTKPFKNDEVRHLVARAVQTSRLRRENKNLRRALEQRFRFEKIIGKSRPMQEVYRFIEQVAPSRSTVFIQGESGTGKELVAQAIHRRSPRRDKPFIVVNSSNIPSELLEDNLFGHVKGAFTGATSNRQGLFQASDGGTIMFDEITTVGTDVQAKLLRVLQNKEFIPLGSVEPRTVDVRILAASNEDVKEQIRAGNFREDLYYRLNVLAITVPPLRHRLEDLPQLVTHFLQKYNEENDKQVESIESEALERLLTYHWPGNVRELENVIERGVVLANGSQIELSSLPKDLEERAVVPAAAAPLPEGVGLYDAVGRYERQLIESALRRAGGVQKQAAKILGLKATTLNEKIKRLGIRI
ncbi:MAG: sigma-54-dependent Fis family transcriptional regulator [Acidobacteria bacterium]|nr:sigma-54-dependent Fis family transcriptional regulator [Acidobacteriota bacterium]